MKDFAHYTFEIKMQKELSLQISIKIERDCFWLITFLEEYSLTCTFLYKHIKAIMRPFLENTHI